MSNAPASADPFAGQIDGLHDVVAIGCGPFNLGLLALSSTVKELDVIAFEARPELVWHPGMMFDDAEFQLSFLADLVTLVDPTHPLSFLAYLRDVDRMYPFFVRERFHPTRREYEAYLRWVAAKLPNIRFSERVTRVHWDHERLAFAVQTRRADGTPGFALAKHLVIGIGTEGAIPDALRALPDSKLLHSADYLTRRSDVERASHVTVVGSGQSGAEVTIDLLGKNLAGGGPCSWLTRTPAFAPLDYTKLVLEMTTPSYVRYFHGLPQQTKDRLVAEQWRHYKGISSSSIEQIHDLLYQRELVGGLAQVELRCGVAIEGAELERSGEVVLSCRHRDTDMCFEHRTSLVVAATGYRERKPSFLAPLEPLLRRDEQGRYRVNLDYSIELSEPVSGRIFVANAELHTHGVATPDLGMCAFRNATILNTVLGRTHYRLPERTALSSFGVPEAHARPASTTREGDRTEAERRSAHAAKRRALHSTELSLQTHALRERSP